MAHAMADRTVNSARRKIENSTVANALLSETMRRDAQSWGASQAGPGNRRGSRGRGTALGPDPARTSPARTDPSVGRPAATRVYHARPARPRPENTTMAH